MIINPFTDFLKRFPVLFFIFCPFSVGKRMANRQPIGKSSQNVEPCER